MIHIIESEELVIILVTSFYIVKSLSLLHCILYFICVYISLKETIRELKELVSDEQRFYIVFSIIHSCLVVSCVRACERGLSSSVHKSLGGLWWQSAV